LGQGLARALEQGDEASFDRLLWSPANQAVDALDVVVLGVAKKVVRNAFVSFQFFLRIARASAPVSLEHRLTWSCIFPTKQELNIVPEAFLHLPQKQKFQAADFLTGTAMTLNKVAVALDEQGSGRLSLGEQSSVRAGEPVADWSRYRGWDVAKALDRIRRHRPGPFDLEVEMQEEVFLTDWRIGDVIQEDQRQLFPIESQGVVFHAPVTPGPEGDALAANLRGLAKEKTLPPLFGLLHYEKCKLMFQPLTLFGDKGPMHLMLSTEKIDRKTLLQALKF
jgi:hypothetical protein